MRKAVNILLFIALIIASAVFTFWLSNDRSLIFTKPPEQILPKLDEKNFEEVLNSFLRGVDEYAANYRKQRRLPEELLKPANLKNEQYITENAALLKDAEANMRSEMQALMEVFAATDEKVNLLLVGKSEEEIIKTRAQWQELKDKQMASYVDFFSFEEDKLELFDRLMALYVAHAATLHYEESSDHTVFADETVKTQEQELRQKILDASQKQIDVIRQNNLENATAQASEASPDITQQPELSPAPMLETQPGLPSETPAE